ncbi:MAG: GNAT family N-acetyltransferase, partial [Clostridia bacterium]|nr:GNAT family N-acetyltransferase [Clostridia bacterium]
WNQHICSSPLVVDENDKLCGVHMLRMEGKKCSFWHCVIDPTYRGKKIGRLLTYVPMAIAADNGFDYCQNWIADTNTPSIRMCSAAGMRFNQVSSYRYVLKP